MTKILWGYQIKEMRILRTFYVGNTKHIEIELKDEGFFGGKLKIILSEKEYNTLLKLEIK